MDFLQSHVFTAFLISILFLIYKALLKKIYKDENNSHKENMKNSVMVFVISYLVLTFKNSLFGEELIKTQVFTKEPDF